MSAQHQQHHHDKVRLTVECTIDERTYIKMLAAKKHKTISEFLLTPLRESMPSPKVKKPNDETAKALKESREGKLESYKTLDDFWNAMGIDPNA